MSWIPTAMPHNPIFPVDSGIPYASSRRPQRLTHGERLAWDTWRSHHPRGGHEVWYDVLIPTEEQGRAGLGPDPRSIADDHERAWYHLRAYRADVISRRATYYTVIELKRHADALAAAQLRRYDQRARITWPLLQWTRPMLIALSVDSDLLIDDSQDDLIIVAVRPDKEDR